VIVFNFILPAIVAVMLAIGQLLFKQCGISIAGKSPAQAIHTLMGLPAFWLSLALYGAATILWIVVLSRTSLARSYLWVALPVVLVPLLAARIFHEELPMRFWLGLAVVLFGMILTQWPTTR
jgi:drug/metabolite transporter (DMT)-like permease